jgi:hypothetical protein
MILYHGTNADIEAIDLTKGLRYKDFGKGFYLTPERTTAVRMAQKKARLFGGTPTLSRLQIIAKAYIHQNRRRNYCKISFSTSNIISELNARFAILTKQTLK